MTKLSLDLDSFELVLFYKSVTDAKYLASIIDYVQPIYFKDKDFKEIFNIVRQFFESRNTVPTTTEIINYCSTSELKANLKSALHKIKVVDQHLNEEEVYSNTEQFLKEKAVFHTMMEVVDKISNKTINTAEILQKFEKSCSINLTQTLGLDLSRDIDVLVRDLQTLQPTISSGWLWLDNMLDGGFLANGRAIYLFAGETNVGKSIFLGNVASNAAKQGKTALVITLEMSELMYAKRLVSGITSIPMGQLRSNSHTIKDALNTRLAGYSGGKILIKEFPPSTLTPNQLSAFLRKVKQQGVNFDIIILDYLNLLHSPLGNNSYERIKHIAEQVRALTYMFSVPIISATQISRLGMGVSNPGMETISESIGTGMTADAMMSIWQDEGDRELNVIRMGMMKNRFGSNSGSTHLHIDYPTLTLTEDEAPSLESVTASAISALDKLGD